MDRIKTVLKELYEIETEFSDPFTLTGNSPYITVCIREHYEDLLLLRMAPRASFDRWANSVAIEERFVNLVDLRNYLIFNMPDIYKQLFEALSEDYKDLQDSYDEATGNHFD